MVRLGRPSNPPVNACPYWRLLPATPWCTASASTALSPVVRSRTRPESRPTTAAAGAENEAGDRLVPHSVIGQHANRVGTGAEEGRLSERDDAGIAEREIERERKQRRDQHLGAETKVIGKGEIIADGDDPRQRLPPANVVAPRQVADGWVLVRPGDGGLAGGRGGRSQLFLPNSPCGRASRIRMVSA